MKTTCLLILENNLDNGSIIIDSNPKDIKQDSFEIELEIETDTPKSFLSLRGLTPGIKADNGLTIKKMIVGEVMQLIKRLKNKNFGLHLIKQEKSV